MDPSLHDVGDGLSQKTKMASCPCCVFLPQDLFLPPPREDERPKESSSSGNAVVVSPLDALNCIEEYAQENLKQRQSDDTQSSSPVLLLVDTHNHAHLKRERHDTYVASDESESQSKSSVVSVVSLTLAVEPADWEDALKYSAGNNENDVEEQKQADFASRSVSMHSAMRDQTLMGLGIHPWYLSTEIQAKDNDWEQRLEALLQEHPSSIVGEVGLCKMAKCARSHPEGKTRGFEFQRQVLQRQLQLATTYQRPVSIHCVQQHGVLLDMLKEIATMAKSEPDKNPTSFVPPTMAFHSFTGTAHHVKALLQWEATLFGEGPNDSKKKKKKKKQQQQNENSNTQKQPPENNDSINQQQQQPRPPLVYFGFSHIVNYEMCTSEKGRRQGRDAIRAVPLDRLLAESDVHHPSDVPAGTAGAIAYIAWALELPIPQVAELTARNGLAFLQSHLLR